jgi:hypothetical protein
MTFDGMYPLRARHQKFKQSCYGKKVAPTQEQAEGGRSYSQHVWSQLWTYDVKAWERAILSIEASNRDPKRYGKSTVYLAYQVQSIAQIETTIRIG